jgi:hypothetical protein
MSAKKAPKTRPRSQPAPAAGGQRARPAPGKSGRKGAGRESKKPLSPLEVQLRKVLAEMGLARSRRVFAAVEASFDDPKQVG